jgi:hypothetical protein
MISSCCNDSAVVEFSGDDDAGKWVCKKGRISVALCREKPTAFRHYQKQQAR